jgi:hypothetical protein
VIQVLIGTKKKETEELTSIQLEGGFRYDVVTPSAIGEVTGGSDQLHRRSSSDAVFADHPKLNRRRFSMRCLSLFISSVPP